MSTENQRKVGSESNCDASRNKEESRLDSARTSVREPLRTPSDPFGPLRTPSHPFAPLRTPSDPFGPLRIPTRRQTHKPLTCKCSGRTRLSLSASRADRWPRPGGGQGRRDGWRMGVLQIAHEPAAGRQRGPAPVASRRASRRDGWGVASLCFSVCL